MNKPLTKSQIRHLDILRAQVDGSVVRRTSGFWDVRGGKISGLSLSVLNKLVELGVIRVEPRRRPLHIEIFQVYSICPPKESTEGSAV